MRYLISLILTLVALSLPGDAAASHYNVPGAVVSYALSGAGITPAHPSGWLLRPSAQAWTRTDVQTFVSRYMRQNGYTPEEMVLATNFLSGSYQPDGTCTPRRSYEPVLPPGGWLLNLMVDLYLNPR